ncbi:MAG TPA: ATP-binding protein [Rubrobacteraceae bacterium]|nr:ATP-binding protein [Rubrobacteraceae bacterium]
MAVLLPTLCIGLFEFLRHQWLVGVLPMWLGHGWVGNVLGALVVAAVVYFFVRVFAGMVGAAALEAARAREEAAVLTERQRIGREMHDGVAQALFYLRAKLNEVGDLLAAGENERTLAELRAAEEELQETHRLVRAAISDLKRQPEIERFDEALRRTVSELAGRMALRLTCEAEAPCCALSAPYQRHLLAIVQEALTNAHRHGNARSASVKVGTSEETLIVEVSDDGSGFDPDAVPQDGRYGLFIMEERARMIGGSMLLDSVPGLGTRILLRVPVRQPVAP